MPELIDFHEAHGDDGRFRILAFHDGSVASLAELDARIEERGIRDKLWEGRELPFPVLLDASGETIERWGIRAFPTMLLIDPEGRFVATVHGRRTRRNSSPRGVASADSTPGRRAL